MIAILGATGKTGRYLVARLRAAGHEVVAVGRSQARLDALDGKTRRVVADFEHPLTVAKALVGATRVVSCAHAGFTGTLLECLPSSCQRLVLIGSTRRFSRLPDPAADAVRAGETAFLSSGVPGVMLHPTMIYGAPDDRNVNRMLRLVRRFPVIPLPNGGRGLLQPLFVDDMVDALAAAVELPAALGASIVVAGPEPISYADMVRACARAVGRGVTIVPVPALLLGGAARLATLLGLRPPFDAAEIRRATEDKSFDIDAMRKRLGVSPRAFEDGLRLKLERGWAS
jgi:uncharacterized protein YbjT (DUF2867 family)